MLSAVIARSPHGTCTGSIFMSLAPEEGRDLSGPYRIVMRSC